MKKYMLWILPIYLVFNIFSFNTNMVRAAELPLSFADSNLNNVFCDFVGKAYGSAVYKSDIDNKMQQLYENDPNGYNDDLDINGVSNLSGMEQLKDLKHPIRSMVLRRTVNSLDPIKDFSLLKLTLINATNDNLKVFNNSTVLQSNLQCLLLNPYTRDNNEQLTDISPISKIKNLKELHINQTNVSDISPIQSLNNLESLLLDGLNRWSSPKVDISLLKALPKLKYLALARLNLDKEDLKVFSESNTFTNLKSLTIFNENRIQDISYLRNRNKIQMLTLVDCDLDDKALEIIKTMKGVRDLVLSTNRIRNITAFKDMPELININLERNLIENIEPISNLVNLRQVFLAENYITDISPLIKLNNLLSVDITNNFIDVFNTQKENLNKIKATWGVRTDSQLKLIGKDRINLNVSDSVHYSASGGKVIELSSNEALVEVKKTNDGIKFEDYSWGIIGEYKFIKNNANIDINYIYDDFMKLTAVSPGEVTLSTLFKNIDSPFTRVDTNVLITGTIPKPIIKGSITIKYQDENGTDIETPDIMSDLELKSYTRNAKNIEGYTLVGTDSQRLTLTEDSKDQTIVFKYKKIKEKEPVIKGKYIIRYVDENGNLLEPETINSDLALGVHFAFSKNFQGYTLNDSSMKSVLLTELEKEQIITFVYEKVILGTIIVQFIDNEGNLLEPETVKSDLKLGAYIEEFKNFEGYTLNDTQMKTVILNKEEPIKTIRFTYFKNEEPKVIIKGSITIKYQDENGTDIETPDIMSDLELKSYTRNAKNIEGYTLVGTDSQRLTLTEDSKDQTIVFKYKKIIQSKVSEEKPIEDKPIEKIPQTGYPMDNINLIILGALFIISGISIIKLKKDSFKIK